ncbi:uncharacterized protein BYT42DRAFT_610886 [Radiomyces spectabilis]|uniref:uncharacterized protein n=1 Tax=Radiomyces spectabilis TaxID=64574 RepID=UPI00221F9967|nr:uncharacterized protein BYT42DRAFT_610886 [Radiomyces spectabilis]KAI8391688.1 hypothetical protein BYT42DRAFT_610886 [Radiomyces spectabilis]
MTKVRKEAGYLRMFVSTENACRLPICYVLGELVPQRLYQQRFIDQVHEEHGDRELFEDRITIHGDTLEDCLGVSQRANEMIQRGLSSLRAGPNADVQLRTASLLRRQFYPHPEKDMARFPHRRLPHPQLASRSLSPTVPTSYCARLHSDDLPTHRVEMRQAYSSEDQWTFVQICIDAHNSDTTTLTQRAYALERHLSTRQRKRIFQNIESGQHNAKRFLSSDECSVLQADIPDVDGNKAQNYIWRNMQI